MVRCGTTRYSRVKQATSISTGVPRSISCSSQRPAVVSKIASANSRVDSARLVAASSAPSVITVQYTRKRLNLGRAVGTRQMRLKMDSTLVSVTSSETISAITPAVVICSLVSRLGSR